MDNHTGLRAAIAAIALVGWATVPAFARPPTVGVNPGYDRRLIESRKQLANPDTATVPAPHKRHVRHRD